MSTGSPDSTLDGDTARLFLTTAGRQRLAARLAELEALAQTLLQQLAESSDDPLVKAMAENGVASGYEGGGRFADAAGHYRRAAELTRLEDERDIYLANAARAYQAAGNKAEAVAIWRQLIDSEGTQSAEARVRLGELTAEPAKQG